MSREEIREPQRYYTIVGGSFRTQVSQDDPAAVRRDWTSADGKSSGTKYERVVNALYGKIEGVSFMDGEYGEQLVIKLDAGEDGIHPKIALNMQSREAESLLKRLPNVDLSQEVRLRPYSFEDDGEEVRGIEVLQPNESGDFKVKVGNYFRDTERKVNINGYPNPEGDTESYSKDDWKIYFLTCRRFLVNYTKEHIIPRFETDRSQPVGRTEEDYERGMDEALGGGKTEGPNPDDIPF